MSSFDHVNLLILLQMPHTHCLTLEGGLSPSISWDCQPRCGNGEAEGSVA